MRRLLWAVGTLVLTAFFAYGIIRLLRPDRYPGERACSAALWRDVEDALFGFDARRGRTSTSSSLRGCGSTLPTSSCSPAGWSSRVGLGRRAAALWCAARTGRGPRARSRARRSSSSARPSTSSRSARCCCSRRRSGSSSCPYFFDPHSYAPPLEDPWDFIRSMLVPWLVVGAPLAGGDPAPHARADARLDGRGLGAHRARQGPAARAGRAPPRRAGLVRDRAVAVRRLGAVHGHEHRARRVGVLDPGLLPPHAAGARARHYGCARELHRHPDAPGPGDVGGGADRGGLAARRPGDRARSTRGSAPARRLA